MAGGTPWRAAVLAVLLVDTLVAATDPRAYDNSTNSYNNNNKVSPRARRPSFSSPAAAAAGRGSVALVGGCPEALEDVVRLLDEAHQPLATGAALCTGPDHSCAAYATFAPAAGLPAGLRDLLVPFPTSSQCTWTPCSAGECGGFRSTPPGSNPDLPVKGPVLAFAAGAPPPVVSLLAWVSVPAADFARRRSVVSAGGLLSIELQTDGTVSCLPAGGTPVTGRSVAPADRRALHVTCCLRGDAGKVVLYENGVASGSSTVDVHLPLGFTSAVSIGDMEESGLVLDGVRIVVARDPTGGYHEAAVLSALQQTALPLEDPPGDSSAPAEGGGAGSTFVLVAECAASLADLPGLALPSEAPYLAGGGTCRLLAGKCNTYLAYPPSAPLSQYTLQTTLPYPTSLECNWTLCSAGVCGGLLGAASPGVSFATTATSIAAAAVVSGRESPVQRVVGTAADSLVLSVPSDAGGLAVYVASSGRVYCTAMGHAVYGRTPIPYLPATDERGLHVACAWDEASGALRLYEDAGLVDAFVLPAGGASGFAVTDGVVPGGGGSSHVAVAGVLVRVNGPVDEGFLRGLLGAAPAEFAASPDFLVLSAGAACPEGAARRIETVALCSHAAEALGIPYAAAPDHPALAEAPVGCHYRADAAPQGLWLNGNRSKSAAASPADVLICVNATYSGPFAEAETPVDGDEDDSKLEFVGSSAFGVLLAVLGGACLVSSYWCYAKDGGMLLSKSPAGGFLGIVDEDDEQGPMELCPFPGCTDGLDGAPYGSRILLHLQQHYRRRHVLKGLCVHGILVYCCERCAGNAGT
ncbi:hypothetical protein DIPPA_23742 [Diplonema papillatum]|nr:hypothetical protein DIPPA_23742 [Diplonema papillatum]|eukprot:gene7428-11411_t